MKPRTPIPRMSPKKLSSLDGKYVGSTITGKRKAIKKKARTKSERERIYGPQGYVEWIHEQPCIACGVVGFSECAHLETGGTGRKCDWTFTAPLCHDRMVINGYRSLTIRIGCHRLFDLQRWNFEFRFPDFNAETAAKRCQELWLEFSGEAK